MEDAQSQCSSPETSTTDLPRTIGDMDVDSVVDKNSDEGNLGLGDEEGSTPRARNETANPTVRCYLLKHVVLKLILG